MIFRRSPRDPLADLGLDGLRAEHRAEVEEAVSAARRFEAIRDRTPEGPTRTRLDELLGQVHEAVFGIRDAASAVERKAATLADLDPDGVQRQLKEARRALSRAEEDGRPTDVLRRTAASLDRQLAAVHGTWDAVEASERALHELQLRLGEVVALAGAVAAEASVRAGRPSGLDDVALELSTLHEALSELRHR